jgi:iron complex transport system substrate-binding protein
MKTEPCAQGSTQTSSSSRTEDVLMKRSLLLLVMLLAVAACGPAGSGATTNPDPTTSAPVHTTTTPPPSTITTVSSGFPVSVEADNGTVIVEQRPDAIVSLSAVATEMLFAIGAGPQVIAVDDQSNFPEEAPMTDLSGFTPNVEAILSYEPDLVFITFDPGDLIASLEAAGIPVISYTAALTLDDVYRQMEAIGAATGHPEDAITVNEMIEKELSSIVEGSPDVDDGTTYYHEIDNALYSVTSSTFFGQIYAMFGLVNIADEADVDGSGYPQLSSEYIVASDPDLIFLADTLYGESAETLATRPGWDVLGAVSEDNVIELDSDIASRWGPRIVDFARSVSDGLDAYVSQG